MDLNGHNIGIQKELESLLLALLQASPRVLGAEYSFRWSDNVVGQ